MADSSQNVTEVKLTRAGEKLIETLLDPRNRTKSVSDICKLAETSRTTYYKLFADETFVKEYKRQSKELITQNVGSVINTFINEAKRGSFQHGKVILEMADMYTEKKEIDATVTMPSIIIGK